MIVTTLKGFQFFGYRPKLHFRNVLKCNLRFLITTFYITRQFIKDIKNQKILQIIHQEITIQNRSYQVLKAWTQVRVLKNGNWKTEWRCSVIQKAPFSNESRRCCFTCLYF